MLRSHSRSAATWILGFMAFAGIAWVATDSYAALPTSTIKIIFTNTSPSKSVEVRVRGTSSRDQNVYFQAVIPPGRSVTTTAIPPNHQLGYNVRETIGQGKFVGPQNAKLSANTKVTVSPCTTAARWCFRFYYF